MRAAPSWWGRQRTGGSGQVGSCRCAWEKGKEGSRRGQRTRKAQKSKGTDWYSESCPPGLAVPPSPLLTLPPHTSFTLHTSHCTLHTTTTVPPPPPPPPPTQRGPPAAQGQAPLIPGRLPCPQRTSAALGGWCPLLLARACPGRTRTSQPPRCTATLNRARKRIFLWLAWWGSHASIGTGPVHRGLPPPCSSGSRNGTLLLLSVHTTSDRTSGSDWRCKIPTAALGTLADELRKWCLGLELRSICFVAGSKCRSMACKSISIPPPLVRPRADGQACKFTVSKHNTGRGGSIPRSR